MSTSSFDLLCQELADFQASRAAQQARPARAPRRDIVTRATAPRPMAKALPDLPVKPPDFDRLSKVQDAIAADMAKSHALHVQAQIRGHIADLRKAARAGRLTANDAAKLDVFIGQAARLGLTP